MDCTVESICKNYARKSRAYRKTYERLSEEIARLEAEKKALQCPRWTDVLVKPIARLLIKEFPDRYYEILGPFGLQASTAIHFYRKGVSAKEQFERDNCISINFVPGDLNKGELFIQDTATDTGRYSYNTIGELNGMNHPNLPMPENPLEWMIDYLHKQEDVKLARVS